MTDVFELDLDSDQRQWETAPSMKTGRFYHSCSLVTKASGEEEIVVLGGVNNRFVEIFSVNDRIWRDG